MVTTNINVVPELKVAGAWRSPVEKEHVGLSGSSAAPETHALGLCWS